MLSSVSTVLMPSLSISSLCVAAGTELPMPLNDGEGDGGGGGGGVGSNRRRLGPLRKEISRYRLVIPEKYPHSVVNLGCKRI
jgi:hypothetical protein